MPSFHFFLPVIEQFRMLAYFALLGVSFAESVAFIGMAIPGTAFLTALGFLSSLGVFSPYFLFIFSVLGAIAGDIVSYYLGRYSHKIIKPGSRIFREEYIERGENFIKKHGNKSIILGRFIGPFRAVIPFVAGMFKMEKKKFFPLSVVSAFIWSAGYLLIGYFFGEAWQELSLWSTRLSVLIFWGVVFLASFYFAKWFFIKKGRKLISFLISLFRSMVEGIKDDPNIQKFSARHPVLVNFLKNRLAKDGFSGVKLTIIILVFIYAAWNFAKTAAEIVGSGYQLVVDLNFADLLHVFRNPIPTRIFLWITLLGQWKMVAAVVFVSSLLMWIWNKRSYILPLILSVTGSAAAGTLVKIVWHRPRPTGLIPAYLEKSWSFPSLHAIISVSLYGFLVYFFWKHLKKWKNKINALFFGLLIILAVGFSRLYLGVHYLSDVWAGYMLGLMWMLVSIVWMEWQDAKTIDRIDEDISRRPARVKTSTAVLLCLLAFFYFCVGLSYNPPLITASEEIFPEIISVDKILDIFSNYQIPKFTETLTGKPQEPFSIIIIAKDGRQLSDVFKAAGWNAADNINFNTLATEFRSEVFNQPYTTAPITPYFWRTNTNDFGFEKPTGTESARYRHHCRFWETNFMTNSGYHVYTGITSLDMGIKWWGLTHKIEPDIDTEREFLFNDLEKTGEVAKYDTVQFVNPILGKNFTGDQFFTDGKVYVIYLK